MNATNSIACYRGILANCARTTFSCSLRVCRNIITVRSTPTSSGLLPIAMAPIFTSLSPVTQPTSDSLTDQQDNTVKSNHQRTIIWLLVGAFHGIIFYLVMILIMNTLRFWKKRKETNRAETNNVSVQQSEYFHLELDDMTTANHLHAGIKSMTFHYQMVTLVKVLSLPYHWRLRTSHSQSNAKQTKIVHITATASPYRTKTWVILYQYVLNEPFKIRGIFSLEGYNKLGWYD